MVFEHACTNGKGEGEGEEDVGGRENRSRMSVVIFLLGFQVFLVSLRGFSERRGWEERKKHERSYSFRAVKGVLIEVWVVKQRFQYHERKVLKFWWPFPNTVSAKSDKAGLLMLERR